MIQWSRRSIDQASYMRSRPREVQKHIKHKSSTIFFSEISEDVALLRHRSFVLVINEVRVRLTCRMRWRSEISRYHAERFYQRIPFHFLSSRGFGLGLNKKKSRIFARFYDSFQAMKIGGFFDVRKKILNSGIVKFQLTHLS